MHRYNGIKYVEQSIATEQLQGLSYDNFKQALAKAGNLTMVWENRATQITWKRLSSLTVSGIIISPTHMVSRGKDGKVDMSKYESHNNTRPGGYVNFGLWLLWASNRHLVACQPLPGLPPVRSVKQPMEIYQSSLQQYSRHLGDFNRQVFSVIIVKNN